MNESNKIYNLNN